ncbi:hypothetical protein QRD02_11885 [Aequorivita sp. SDUM287046]|uniref:Uncharacterized protein n=1 Tax=Aequorivita aurantiaca TaxID=3053356 RepID=A0ABT8DI60_9FLAO|nr:hypothetical protein [Aequorivita aurantiaca]MDN3725086.1 hypothetical protein [Aequorivita aurantiaca]
MAKNPEYTDRNFRIRVDFEQPPQVDLPLIGFLFNCKGLLLQWQYVKENFLEFNLENRSEKTMERKLDPEQFRLFIAPASDKKITRVKTMEQLQGFKAYEPILRLNDNHVLDILPIPERLSIFWLKCKCRVSGKVSKWFNFGNGWEDLPVCRARVHICEIDPINYWIQKIPDHIIAKIPDAILNPKFEVPIPIPDPDPFRRLERFPNISGQEEENIFKTQSLQQIRNETLSVLPELGADIKKQLSSGNLNSIREAIVKNYALFHPWFCYWPWWWPHFYRCQELAVVETNAAGRFEKNIYYHCFGDKPDIYIWVEYMIGGVWTTVHKPPKPCNTHWNYVCGTDINIHVSDPRVAGDCCCDCELIGEDVWIRTVGHTSVSHIKQTHQLLAPPGQTVPYDRIGLTDAAAAGDSFITTTIDDYKRPFGGSPVLRMGFAPALPNSNVYYYRWSYRQRANADLTIVGDTYNPLPPKGGEVRKGYEYRYTDSNGDWQWAPESKKLGPFSVGPNDNLYIIPPEEPTMAPFNVPAASHPHWHQQTYNMDTIHFDTTVVDDFENGLYELKLELFDQAGNLLQNIPKANFKTPRHDDARYSENAPNILLENPTTSNADAFRMLIRIDNGQCEGAIYTVNVGGVPASSTCCGFVKYKPEGVEADLELSFKATHPTDFAEFSFGVIKGTCMGGSIANARGMVIDSADGYHLNTMSGVYSKSFMPADLLGVCYEEGFGKAAFAETLHILSTATDGIWRVAQDYHQTAAFALEP